MEKNSNIKKIVKSLDLFSHSCQLKLHDQYQYSSWTGSITTIIIYIIFLIVFLTTIIGTFMKTNILYSKEISQGTEQLLQLITAPQLMFGVGVNGFNLNDSQRYFDIVVIQNQRGNNQNSKKTINLVPCDISMWNMTSTMADAYHRRNFSQFLCPSYGQQLQVAGFYGDNTFKYVQIGVRKCDPQLDPSRPCSNGSAKAKYLQEFKHFNFNFYFINTRINPGSSNFISYFIEDRNYIPFIQNSNKITNIFLSKYSVITEESIWPIYHDTKQKTGVMVSNLGQSINNQIVDADYAKFVLRRNSEDISYIRSYQKLDVMFAYLGGLFQLLLMFFIFLKWYNQMSYQIKIAKDLFEGENIQEQKLNLFSFFGYKIVKFFDYLCPLNIQNEQFKKYSECVKYMQKQLNIITILSRISILEQISFKFCSLQQKKIIKNQQLTFQKMDSRSQLIEEESSTYKPLDKTNKEGSNIKPCQKKQNIKKISEQIQKKMIQYQKKWKQIQEKQNIQKISEQIQKKMIQYQKKWKQIQEILKKYDQKQNQKIRGKQNVYRGNIRRINQG